ncbi:MAG TPA: transcriptional repressor [Gammaproteobacteria bacterium]|nr:transcriptional repressor [Gammaproteobacteria bacterium]
MEHTSTQDLLSSAEQRCIEQGSKLTLKRRQVLTGLLESNKALSAYELTEFCREQLGYGLLPMSVYRILEFLEDNDLVHRLNTSNKYIACSHIACDHDHESPQFLICKACFRVKEVGIPNSIIKSITKTIEAVNYHLANKQLEIECFCEECATTDCSSA